MRLVQRLEIDGEARPISLVSHLSCPERRRIWRIRGSWRFPGGAPRPSSSTRRPGAPLSRALANRQCLHDGHWLNINTQRQCSLRMVVWVRHFRGQNRKSLLRCGSQPLPKNSGLAAISGNHLHKAAQGTDGRPCLPGRKIPVKPKNGGVTQLSGRPPARFPPPPSLTAVLLPQGTQPYRMARLSWTKLY